MRIKTKLSYVATRYGACLAFGSLYFAAGWPVPVGLAAIDEDRPVIIKDTIQVTAFTFNSYQKNYDVWSWAPVTSFHVRGPIASGSQLYVEVKIPGSAAPLKYDCQTGEIPKGNWWKTECGGREGVPEDKGSTYTGPVEFAIKMRNELAGSDATLFTGTAKVAKAHSNETGPKFAKHFVYYIDQDWKLPIGYIFLTPSDPAGMKRPLLNAAFWVRGDASKMEPHLIYNGKEVGKIYYGSDEVGKPVCTPDVENATTHYVDNSLPQKASWSRVVCQFFNVWGWDKTGNTDVLTGRKGTPHQLSGNPGDYEVKVLWQNHLARSIKFTVDADGKFDNGIAKENQLGANRVIVPVEIIGDQDGNWDRAAWKTDAFYGNPLKGFTAVR